MSAQTARKINGGEFALPRNETPAPVRLKPVISAPLETAMHPHIYRIALGVWLVFLSIFWMTFWISANALFMVVIGTFYAAMFFGVPYILARQVPGRTKAKGSLLAFLEKPFVTNSGVIQGYEALLQVILVPLCLILGGGMIGVIIRAARGG